MPYETLLCEKREAIAYVTINRPEKLNALNRRVIDELDACFTALEADDGILAVILTGAG